MKIQFAPPYVDDDVINEVVDTLKSGWITTGSKVKALEDNIKKLSGAKEVLCVNSWTSGAIMMLRWLGLKEGDEVIVPAYTYCATAMAVLWAGGKPVMVDSNEDFHISIEAIKNAITPKTKAIIPVDIAGFPCNYDAINSLVCNASIKKMYQAESPVQEQIGRILVIADSAHSLGAKYNLNTTIGNQTDIVVFSLHAVKNITTAEGGAICLNLPKPFDNKQLYAMLKQMSLNFQTKDAFAKSKLGGWRYDIVGQGMKINMADVNAAIGLAQIRKYKDLLNQRKHIFEIYNNGFSQYDWAIIPKTIEGEKESSYHFFALRIKGITEKVRDNIIDEISKHNVGVNVHFVPLPMLTFFKSLGYNINNYPQSYKNYSTEISLPVYPQLGINEVQYVIKTVVDAYNVVVNR